MLNGEMFLKEYNPFFSQESRVKSQQLTVLKVFIVTLKLPNYLRSLFNYSFVNSNSLLSQFFPTKMSI